jgi:hypothetical protein
MGAFPIRKGDPAGASAHGRHDSAAAERKGARGISRARPHPGNLVHRSGSRRRPAVIPRGPQAGEGIHEQSLGLGIPVSSAARLAGMTSSPVMAVAGLGPGDPAFRPMALILRSSREAASRRRISVLSGPSFETPLAAAPQDEAEQDGRDHGP